MRAVKNYRSDIPINRIFEQLQKILSEHGARQITFDYRADGKVAAVTFVIIVNSKPIPVRLPARVEQAQALLKKQFELGLISRKIGKKVYEPDHAYRVAWRNILDWVDAQMALLDIEMARLEEVFLPYMVMRSGETFLEAIDRKQFQLDSGQEEVPAA